MLKQYNRNAGDLDSPTTLCHISKSNAQNKQKFWVRNKLQCIFAIHTAPLGHTLRKVLQQKNCTVK